MQNPLEMHDLPSCHSLAVWEHLGIGSRICPIVGSNLRPGIPRFLEKIDIVLRNLFLLMIYGTDTSHWKEVEPAPSEIARWQHRHNPSMKVKIFLNRINPRRGKYFIYHTHATRTTKVVPQELESADTLKVAREKAEVHLRHWNDETLWGKHQ